MLTGQSRPALNYGGIVTMVETCMYCGQVDECHLVEDQQKMACFACWHENSTLLCVLCEKPTSLATGARMADEFNEDANSCMDIICASCVDTVQTSQD